MGLRGRADGTASGQRARWDALKRIFIVECRKAAQCYPSSAEASSNADPIFREGKMTGQEHFERLQRAYQAARCNDYYAPTLTVSQGASEVTLLADPKYFHGGGAVHGSVYFKALDDAAFFAASSLVRDVAVVTVSMTIHFVRPVSEGRLYARGRVVHAGERLLFAESSLTDSEDRLLATGAGTFTRTNIALSPAMGYA
jgi:uncharacterized protein (TIGR00369 family)